MDCFPVCLLPATIGKSSISEPEIPLRQLCRANTESRYEKGRNATNKQTRAYTTVKSSWFYLRELLGLDPGLAPTCEDRLSGVLSMGVETPPPPSTEKRLRVPNPLARMVAGGVNSSLGSENSLYPSRPRRCKMPPPLCRIPNILIVIRKRKSYKNCFIPCVCWGGLQKLLQTRGSPASGQVIFQRWQHPFVPQPIVTQMSARSCFLL